MFQEIYENQESEFIIRNGYYVCMESLYTYLNGIWQMLLKNGSVAVMSIAAAMEAVLAKAMKTKLLIKIMII